MVRFLFIACCAGTLTAPALAQSAPAPASAQVNNSIVRQHKPGSWSLLGVTATNSNDSDQEALVAVFPARDPSRQFARRVAVPPHARRTTFLPIHVPAGIAPELKQLEFTSIGLDPHAAGRETFQRREGGELVSNFPISISHEPVKSAIFSRRPDTTVPGQAIELDSDARDTLIAARKVADLPQLAHEIPSDFLPPWSETLDQFDHFLLTTDRIADDPAGIVALRSWIRGGGRLWLMLDRVSPHTVRLLLGNAMDFELVDRVPLDEYVLLSPDRFGQLTVRDECEYETPVDFVRVATSARDVLCRIDDWPAAFSIPLGEGEVLITTLAPRGWLMGAKAAPTKALGRVAQRLLSTHPERVDLKALQPALEQRIGYRIPGRTFGAVVLGAYCLALIVGGAISYRRQQAERFLWVVGLATCLATGILVAAGTAHSRSVPPTVALTHLVAAAPESDELFVQGVAAVFDQQSRPVQWRAAERGWAIPDAVDNAPVRRQVWTGDDASETSNVATRAGSVSFVRLSEVRPLTEHFAVRARFGPRGLEGRFTDPHAGLRDPVIVAAIGPSLALRLKADGSFTATPDDLLPANQFSAEALLSDEQRRRQDVLRRLLDQTDTLLFPRTISVAAWREPFPSALQSPEGFGVDGEALVFVPVELEPTPGGSEFRIPATFLKISAAREGSGQSVAFDSRNGQWLQKLTGESDTNLRFQLPPQVLPCQLTHGTLSVRLHAPSREFTVWTMRDGERLSFRTVANPSGVYDFDLGPEQLALDDQGRVRIGLSVGPTSTQRAADAQTAGSDSAMEFTSSTWQIEYVRLSVAGRTSQEESSP